MSDASVTFPAAALAGVISFLSPCILPLAPPYMAYLAGASVERLSREDEASAQFGEAVRLHPDSWAIWRQTAQKDARGLAAGEAFWARVDALGDRPYYTPAELADIPPEST